LVAVFFALAYSQPAMPWDCKKRNYREGCMQRREFITFLAGAAFWPLSAHAQQRGKVPSVGVLWHAGSAEEEAIYLSAFQQGLNGLGYIGGRTITLEHRFPNEQAERFVSLAAELVGLKVDVLVAVTGLAAVAAQRTTTTIPIVFILVPDPLGTKLVSSLARPGGNITGLTNIAVELSAKRLAIFKEVFPRATRVALLVNPTDKQSMQRFIDETKTAATSLGLDVQPVEVRSIGDIEQALDRVVEGRLEGALTVLNGVFYQGRSLIAEAAIARGLPLMVNSRETLLAGGLMSYGADIPAIFRRAAAYVDKLLKGEKAADLPVEQPTKFEFLINLKTAKALGLDIAPALLARADEVIE
jgi:putative tryptophan/tyrosine transport system substrate-binding protein